MLFMPLLGLKSWLGVKGLTEQACGTDFGAQTPTLNLTLVACPAAPALTGNDPRQGLPGIFNLSTGCGDQRQVNFRIFRSVILATVTSFRFNRDYLKMIMWKAERDGTWCRLLASTAHIHKRACMCLCICVHTQCHYQTKEQHLLLACLFLHCFVHSLSCAPLFCLKSALCYTSGYRWS